MQGGVWIAWLRGWEDSGGLAGGPGGLLGEMVGRGVQGGRVQAGLWGWGVGVLGGGVARGAQGVRAGGLPGLGWGVGASGGSCAASGGSGEAPGERCWVSRSSGVVCVWEEWMAGGKLRWGCREGVRGEGVPVGHGAAGWEGASGGGSGGDSRGPPGGAVGVGKLSLGFRVGLVLPCMRGRTQQQLSEATGMPGARLALVTPEARGMGESSAEGACILFVALGLGGQAGRS